MIPGLLYYVNEFMGMGYVFIGICASLLYIPCWMVLQWWNTTMHPEITTGIIFAKEENPKPKLYGVLAIVGAVITFLAVIGNWTADIPGMDLMGSYLTGFETSIPMIICAIGVLIAVLQSINFFIPKKTAKPIAFASLALAVLGFVFAALFAVWAPTLDGAFFIAVAGLVVSTVLLVMQVIGVTSKKFAANTATNTE